jgi:hypothetical protein
MSPSIRTAVLATLALLAPAATARAQTIWDLYYESAAIAAADGQQEDSFGQAISLSGDTLAVGVPNDNGLLAGAGSVRVYTRVGSAWILQQTLVDTGAISATFEVFGSSVALSGETLAVGVPGDGVGANMRQGSVRVFTRSGGVWTLQATLTAPDGQSEDRLGQSVALFGDTLVASAPQDTVGGNTAQGSVRVFTRVGGVWTHQQTITAANGAANDAFGRSLSLTVDTLAVGVPLDAVGSNSLQGSVHVFGRSGSTWTVQQLLTASDGAAGDQFGDSVSLSGDTLAVGVPVDDVGPKAENQGSVRVFVRSGTTWTAQPTLTAPGGTSFERFGKPLVLSGDTLVVGRPFSVLGGVRVFARSGSAWIQTAALTAAGSAENSGLGEAIALSGETLAMGWPTDSVGTTSGQGTVRIFSAYRVLNDTTNIGYPSLASAIAGSSAGDRLLVGNLAFAQATGIIDSSQKRFNFTALEPLTVNASTLMNLATNTVFEKSPDVASGGLTIAGDLSAPQNGSLTFEQLTVSSGGQLLQRGSTLLVNQNLATTSGGVCYLQGPILAEAVTTAVGSQNRCAGDTDVFANYTNAGSTVVQRGILYIYGTLTNTGTITGEVDTHFLPPSPGDGYSIGGDYVVSAESSIVLPDPVWWLRVGGNFDVAINASNRFVMDQATLELTGVGPGSLQSVEVLSRDLGAVDSGFATTNYTLGALRLRAGATVSLANNHNNAPGKGNEAIYTNELVVPAGATLTTNGLKIYTRIATIAGTVSNPNDIVVVPGTPPCVADIVTDGVVNGADLALVLTNWGPCAGSTCVADIDRDGVVGASDLSIVLASWGGCAN